MARTGAHIITRVKSGAHQGEASDLPEYIAHTVLSETTTESTMAHLKCPGHL